MCLESTKEKQMMEPFRLVVLSNCTHQVGNKGRTEQVEPEIEMHHIAEDSLMRIVKVAAGQ